MRKRAVGFLSFFGVALVLTTPGLVLSVSPAASGEKLVDFDRDIRPILATNCFACHGPDAKQRQANMHFDTRDGGAFDDRGGYRVIVPGKSTESRMIQRLTAKDPAIRMPPPYADRRPTEAQIELIRRWIDEGAKWERHWSFIPPERPPVPQVKDRKWPRNPIDNFVMARLEPEGLKPSPEADKATLVRRVTFDLTGLPPTLAELDSFLKDKSPNAYEKRVDQLLESPHYGERMAMAWLDVARYADTHGYHIDSLREMWHWRDWVINAYNRNIPYDQFTLEQLAGDLLPNASLGQKIATGFNRNHMINFEGGAIPEEYQNEYVVDRVEATTTTWLGMTMGCARCHDHKFDPIKQKEFYQFYAFFNSIPEKGLDGTTGNAVPVLQLPSSEQAAEMDRLKKVIAAHEAAMPEKDVAAAEAAWEKARLATLPVPSHEALEAHYEMEGSLIDSSGHYRHGRALRGDVTFDEGIIGKAGHFDGEVHVEFGDAPAFDRSPSADGFSLALWLNGEGLKEAAVLQKIDGPRRAGDRGYELLLDDSVLVRGGEHRRRGAHLIARLIHQWPDDAIEVRTKERLTFGSWTHVALVYDGGGKASGLQVYLDGKPAEVDVVKDHLTGPIANSSPLEIGNKLKAAPSLRLRSGTVSEVEPFKGSIDDFRIYRRALGADEVKQLAVYEPVRAILLTVEDKRTKRQREALREYFLTQEASESLRKTYAELKSLRQERDNLTQAIPTTMVMQEMDKPRETHVLGRGDYRNPGDTVTPGVPAFLPPLAKDAPLTRLTLARWLVGPDNPLTARVAVNRYWQWYFGTGLVKTAEDFGTQGEPPSHPELLDWLATEFIRTGWNVKVMQRLIVTSATYRQASKVTPELYERDPENRLLARGPRFRLTAEEIRDNALAVSGLLDDKIGGPSVYPYQPKGLWEEMAFGEGFSGQSYTPSAGKALYRRSMYTLWKRTVPPPALTTFDAPDREKCTARRSRTNTPLQALVLLNDPTYVEAARALAERAMTEGGKDPVRRVDFAFRLATARAPRLNEREVLVQLARQELEQYRQDKAAAQKLLGVGDSKYNSKLNPSELAAWTTVASAILNLDETISKE